MLRSLNDFSSKYFVVWKKVRTFALAFEKYLSNEFSGQD